MIGVSFGCDEDEARAGTVGGDRPWRGVVVDKFFDDNSSGGFEADAFTGIIQSGGIEELTRVEGEAGAGGEDGALGKGVGGARGEDAAAHVHRVGG